MSIAQDKRVKVPPHIHNPDHFLPMDTVAKRLLLLPHPLQHYLKFQKS